MSASWSTFKALRDDPALLAEVEAAFAEQDQQRAEREAISSEGAGRVRGEAPHFTCPRTDKWDKNSSILPRAIIPSPPIPDPDLTEDEQKESLETDHFGNVKNSRALRNMPKAKKTLDGELEQLGNGKGKYQGQAKALYELGQENKAQRLACCGVFGHRIECSTPHSYFERYYCGQRFCRECSARNFTKLFAKYIGLKELVKKRPHWVLARLDFTIRNIWKLEAGSFPGPEVIREMNRAIRRTMRGLLRGTKGWGYLWCDEFGFDNTNVHAHGLYYGPFLQFEEIKLAWAKETGDDLRPAICSAGDDFHRALYHLLKYVSKPPSNDDKRLAELEAAFSGVRRIHTMGAFYNSQLTSDENLEHSDSGGCPACGRPLYIVGGYVEVEELQGVGLQDLEEARRQAAQQKGFARAEPP